MAMPLAAVAGGAARRAAADDGYIPVPAGELPRTAASWTLARRTLYERVHHDRRETLYCGCACDTDNRVDPASCGLHELSGNSRAERVEAEHMFPASRFGNFRQCRREPEAFPACTTSGGNRLSGRTHLLYYRDPIVLVQLAAPLEGHSDAETVPHEVAPIGVFYRSGRPARRPHGPEWRTLRRLPGG